MIEVKTQTELDAALKKTEGGKTGEVHCIGDAEFTINGSSTVWAYDSSTVRASDSSTVWASDSSTVWAYGSSTVRAYGSSTVRASGSSTVRASGSSTVRAYDSSTVRASDSSTVRASGSSTVRASDSSTVWAYGSSTVRAYGSSTVRAYDSSTVEAEEHCPVQIHSTRAKITGGIQITPPAPQAITVTDAIERWGINPLRGKVLLYKAVCNEYKSGRGHAYPIGETVTCEDWHARPECGGGLHISPTPIDATAYFGGAKRWLEVEVAVKDLALCSTHDTFPDKAKARKLKVVREVRLNGSAL